MLRSLLQFIESVTFHKYKIKRKNIFHLNVFFFFFDSFHGFDAGASYLSVIHRGEWGRAKQSHAECQSLSE